MCCSVFRGDVELWHPCAHVSLLRTGCDRTPDAEVPGLEEIPHTNTAGRYHTSDGIMVDTSLMHFIVEFLPTLCPSTFSPFQKTVCKKS